MINSKMNMWEKFKPLLAQCFLLSVNSLFKNCNIRLPCKNQNIKLKKMLFKSNFETFKLSHHLLIKETRWSQKKFWSITSKKLNSLSKNTTISEKKTKVYFKNEIRGTNIMFKRLKSFKRKWSRFLQKEISKLFTQKFMIQTLNSIKLQVLALMMKTSLQVLKD